MIQVTWTDRRGAGRMHQFDNVVEAERLLKTLRCEATARNSAGDVVGEVYRAEGHDDRRIKWMWWLDTNPAPVQR